MTVKPARENAGPGRDTRTSADFDPTAGVFVAQHSRPAVLAPVAPESLSPFQRALLVIDGTVTKFIEAYTGEPVAVTRLEQRDALLAVADPWLNLGTGSPVIRRRVILRGRTTGRFFAWADSVIAASRLAPQMRLGLDTERGGIGQILIDSGLESRREALWYGRERPAEIPAEVAALWPGEFLTRTYRVVADAQPTMLITERFPL